MSPCEEEFVNQKVTALTLCGLVVGLVGFVLSFAFDLERWGQLAWHLQLNSLSLGLACSATLLHSFQWQNGEFIIASRKRALQFLAYFAISSIAGYVFDWGLFYAFFLYPIFLFVMSFCIVIFGWQIASGPRQWQKFEPRKFVWRCLIVAVILCVIVPLIASSLFG